MGEELKPFEAANCPFCGSEPVWNDFAGKYGRKVICSNEDCAAETGPYWKGDSDYRSKLKAVYVWNRRTPATTAHADERETAARMLARALWPNGNEADGATLLHEYQTPGAIDVRVALDVIAAALRAPAALVEWQDISTAPHACHVLATYFDDEPNTCEWVVQTVESPPSRPWTHWRPLPEPPAMTAQTAGERA